jgi:8-oxo-dGTP pyrophosphatase MutT (NUDIX family)
MKAEYSDSQIVEGKKVIPQPKIIDLPFQRISARALIVRRGDGHILGTLHRENGMFALPGGNVEDGESTGQALKRELDEENFVLHAAKWDPRVTVDYFNGYKELNVWHLITVDDVDIGTSEENIESRWFDQDEDVWYPFMQENLILTINRYIPELSTSKVVIQKG